MPAAAPSPPPVEPVRPVETVVLRGRVVKRVTLRDRPIVNVVPLPDGRWQVVVMAESR